MAILQTMYPGVANSPDTFLKEDLTKDATVMYLSDGSVLGTLPTLAVIGGGTDAETVLVTSTAADGGYTIERGVEGERKAWKKADLVARNWTNKDYETIRANIETVNANVLSEADEREFFFDTLSQSINQLNTDLNIAVEDKVDKVDGKGLSTYDYDGEAKAKVDAIPPDPKYTDTIPDLSDFASRNILNEVIDDVSSELERIDGDIVKVRSDHATDIQSVRADIKTRLADMTEDSEHRTVTDAEKKAWSGKVDAVSGKGLSANDYTDAEKEKVARMKESVILTQSEYDALPANEQNDDNKIYFIKA